MSVTFPHQLCRIRPSKLYQVIYIHKERLEHVDWTAEVIESIEHENREMVQAYGARACSLELWISAMILRRTFISHGSTVLETSRGLSSSAVVWRPSSRTRVL